MPIVPILIGVLLIAGIVALVFSASTWRWYHITVVTFIMLLSVVWFYLAARTLKIQQVWRTEEASWEKSVALSEKNHDQIISGGVDPAGKAHLSMDRIKTDVEMLLQGRGRVWDIVNETKVDPNTGVITATIGKIGDKQLPGIEKNTLVFVFGAKLQKSTATPKPADNQDPAQPAPVVESVDTQKTIVTSFLGEFEVSAGALNSPELTLTPALKLRTKELQRIAAARSPNLLIYEIMPNDTANFIQEYKAAFQAANPPKPDENGVTPPPAELSDEDIVSNMAFKNLPENIRQEYLKNGQPATANDPADRKYVRVKAIKEFAVSLGNDANAQKQTIAEGTELLLDPKSAKEQMDAKNVERVGDDATVYVRPLRDYARLHRDLNLEIEELLRKTAVVNSQLAAVQDSQTKVDKDQVYRKAEIAALGRDLNHYNEENAMIKAHVAALEQRVKDVNEEIATAIAESQRQEAELAKLVHDAAAKIDSRSRVAGNQPQ